MKTRSTNCILFFVKSPEPGKVKTRLGSVIGTKEAAELYKCFVEDMLSTIEKVDSELRICFYPPDDMTQVQQWLGDQHSYIAQKGSDLGEKMKNAFVGAFDEGFSKVVIIGSDIPDLPEEFLRQAFDKLDSLDAVIGPSSDGGYYLIGFSKQSFLPDAFKDMVWSTSEVYDQTLAKLKANGLKIHRLSQWHDVDTQKDLDDLVLRNKNTCFSKSRTFAFIQRVTSQS